MHENVRKDSLTFNMLMKHFSTFLADIVITFFWTFIMLKINTWEHRMESRSSLAGYSKFVWTWYVFNKLRDILFIKAFYFLMWKIYKPLWLMQTVSFLTHNKKIKNALLNSRDWPYNCHTLTGWSFLLMLREDRQVRCHMNSVYFCLILYRGKARIKTRRLNLTDSLSPA